MPVALHKAFKLLRAQADEVRADRDHWRERAEQPTAVVYRAVSEFRARVLLEHDGPEATLSAYGREHLKVASKAPTEVFL